MIQFNELYSHQVNPPKRWSNTRKDWCRYNEIYECLLMGKVMGISPEGIRYYRSIQRDVIDPGYLILLLPSCNCYEDCSQNRYHEPEHWKYQWRDDFYNKCWWSVNDQDGRNKREKTRGALKRDICFYFRIVFNFYQYWWEFIYLV